MNILVIGNGFDIAHGLHTKYGDFLRFVQAFHMFTESSDAKDTGFNQFFSSLKEDKPEVYNELNDLTSNNRWLRYFISIRAERQLEGKDGWIDFESEISKIIQALDDARRTLLPHFISGEPRAHLEQRQLNVLCPVIYTDGKVYRSKEVEYDNSFISTQKKKFLNDLDKLTRCFEIYLSTYVANEKCKALKDINGLKIHRVLSFNYTETFKKNYDINSESKMEYDYIHGKAYLKSSIDKCNLVLGIDEYLPDESMNYDNEFIQFKKFYQRIYKGTGCHYVDWIETINTINRSKTGGLPQHNIYFYGHSLDVTDKDILYKLIMADRFRSTIFYHSKEALGKMIANLVKIIGEKELIRRTDGNNRKIVFQQTSTETV